MHSARYLGLFCSPQISEIMGCIMALCSVLYGSDVLVSMLSLVIC